MVEKPRPWWRVLEPREFPKWETEGPQFAWCGHQFFEGTVNKLETDDITVYARLVAEDDARRRSVDSTSGDTFRIPRGSFRRNGDGLTVGMEITIHLEYLPDGVRMFARRPRAGTRRKRQRALEISRRLSCELLDWGPDDSEALPEDVPAPTAKRAYPVDPEEIARKGLQDDRWALMRNPVAHLFDPPNRQYRFFGQPHSYLKGMRVVDPSELDLDSFRAVGKSDYAPRPGALLDVRKFFLAEGEYPSEDLRRCGIPQDEGYVVEIPFVEAIEADDPRILTDETLREMVLDSAKYRETIPGGLFMNDRPAGVEEGILTRLWAPRPEGGSFCHVKAEWSPGGLDP